MADNIFRIDPIYIRYRKMWKENRWQFSGELVKLTIKENKVGLDTQETYIKETMNRIVDENDGNWTEGYDWYTQALKSDKSIIKKKRD